MISSYVDQWAATPFADGHWQPTGGPANTIVKDLDSGTI
jgi:hypothetical protein